MKAFYCYHYVLPLPAGHRFPMAKYRLLRERLLAEGVLAFDDLLIPEPVSELQLRQAHEAEYVRRVLTGQFTEAELRRLGFPWSPQLVERSRRSSGGTLAACRVALQEGYAANLAGGTHHAGKNFAEGFCVFNDAAVATRALQCEGVLERVFIVDCDVHQGNGTADIFQGDDRVYTFSIHGENNFPHRKVPGSLDVGLPDGAGDVAYLDQLDAALQKVFEVFRAELVIYLAGADPFEGDPLGRLKMSKEGLLARDRMVFDYCEQSGVPVALAMAGGYAPVNDIVTIQAATIREAALRQCSKVTA
jgi:acetoin utilization deacetylase AcuC-like enzyme